MTDLRVRLRGFVREMRRRKVFRVGVAYGLGAWLVVQVCATVFPALHLPPWTVTFIVVLAIAGLPAAAILAWYYDVVPDPGGPGHDGQGGRTEAESALAWAAAPTAPPPHSWFARRAEPESGPGQKPATGGLALPHPRKFAKLPVAPTPFIGRAVERRDLLRLLGQLDRRLVTVTGAGGVGKTRLALEVAAAAQEAFRDGVVFVPLSGLASGELIAPKLVETLELSLTSREAPLAQLRDFLREKQLLLVLDNFDDLTASAGLVGELFAEAVGIKVLATSRERLGLQAETLFPLGGLSLPPGADDDGDAVRLFLGGARRLDRGFAPDGPTRACVTEICTLLGGVPLAIELAASWIRVLSCPEILAELQQGGELAADDVKDLPERHRSLRAAFDASWRLLTEEERSALARISVFRGGFTRDAAATVAGADLGELRGLVGKSLLQSSGGRFDVLEVIRQYAAERLVDEPDAAAAVRARHRNYYLGLLARHESGLSRAERVALASVAEETDNIGAAWADAAESVALELIQDCMSGLYHSYDVRGWLQQGLSAFDLAAAALGQAAAREGASNRLHRLALARLAVRRGALAMGLGEHARAEALIQPALAQLRELGAPDEVAFAVHQLGQNRSLTGDVAAAEALYGEALELYEAQGNRLRAGHALANLGNVAYRRGLYAEARRYYDRALERAREASDHVGTWKPTNNLAVLAAVEKDFERAKSLFRDVLAVAIELGNQRAITTALLNLGVAAMEVGEDDEAVAYLNECSPICEEMGYQGTLAMVFLTRGKLALRRRDTAAAVAAFRRGLRTALAAGSAPVALEGLVALARLRRTEGALADAAELLIFVTAHAAADEEAKNRARSELAEIESELGAEMVAVVRKRAGTHTLEQLVSAIVDGHDARVST